MCVCVWGGGVTFHLFGIEVWHFHFPNTFYIKVKVIFHLKKFSSAKYTHIYKCYIFREKPGFTFRGGLSHSMPPEFVHFA